MADILRFPTERASAAKAEHSDAQTGNVIAFPEHVMRSALGEDDLAAAQRHLDNAAAIIFQATGHDLRRKVTNDE